MQIKFPKNQVSDPEKSIRRCGYSRVVDRRSGGQVSYARRMSPVGLYPRFHVYVVEQGEEVVFNLHLDQRATMYEGVTAHSGEYDGEVVEREGGRITKLING